MPMSHIFEARKKIPVYSSADVVVIGGGPAGVCVAISASRNGAKTLLIERYGFLGGLSTGGLVITLYGGSYDGKSIVGGLYQEIITKLRARKEADAAEEPTISPEGLKFILDEYKDKENIELYLHSLAVNAIVDDKTEQLKYIVLEGKGGRLAVEGKVFVDATGDADTVKWCDLPYEMESLANLRPVTTVYRMANVNVEKAKAFRESPAYAKELVKWKKKRFHPVWCSTLNPGEVWMDDVFVHKLDTLSSPGLTKAELLARKKIRDMVSFYKSNYPGFEHAYLLDTASILGIRETRRIKGKYVLTQEDVMNNKIFDDSIALSSGPKGVFSIPYRCLLPQKVSNLLFAGRCISVEHGALDYVRNISQCMATGEAAGVAASLIARKNLPSMALSARELRKALRQFGCLA